MSSEFYILLIFLIDNNICNITIYMAKILYHIYIYNSLIKYLKVYLFLYRFYGIHVYQNKYIKLYYFHSKFSPHAISLKSQRDNLFSVTII